jgi:DNA ligase (NAD+)
MLSHDNYLELVEKCIQLNNDYYQKNESTVSDKQYDNWYQQLKKYEDAHPLLIAPNSPTQQVGATPAKGFSQYTHQSPLLSLSNAFDDNDLEKFLDRITKETTMTQFNLSIEPKIDGCAVSIIYKKGSLYLAATRGNGKVGEVVTHNIRTILSLPKSITHEQDLEIRGEVYISKSNFEKIKSDFANPRNAASGALRQLDANITKERFLDIYIYGSSTSPYDSHCETINWLKSLGFPVIPTRKLQNNAQEILSEINKIQTSPFHVDIDGAVIKVDSDSTRYGNNIKSAKMGYCI